MTDEPSALQRLFVACSKAGMMPWDLRPLLHDLVDEWVDDLAKLGQDSDADRGRSEPTGVRDQAEWDWLCLAFDRLRAERDAAVKAAAAARESVAELEAELDDLRAIPPVELQTRIEQQLRRDLAEARGETERVRRDYRAYNQRLRDGVAKIADMLALARLMKPSVELVDAAVTDIRALLNPAE